jgi:hypothetical protein
MEQYRFFIDRKVTSWVREWHEVEAESLEAAKKEMIGAFHDNMCVETFDEQEYLEGTEDYMEPGENGGNATAELYCVDEVDDSLLTTNIDLVDSN